MAGKSQTTADHKKIRKWVEERVGFPAACKGTGMKDEPCVLRIHFPGCSGEKSLEHIAWEDFIGISLIKQRSKMVEKLVVESDGLASAREVHGIERLNPIKYTVLERSGGISVILKGET